jgi:lipid II:glycine glycyltransferase (peptidoglycan interpeptide bridge formation enzyme)
MDDKTVVAGTIVAYRGDTMHYLYGATNRSVGNHGGHIQLQHEIMAR